jgi:hypothetical protein
MRARRGGSGCDALVDVEIAGVTSCAKHGWRVLTYAEKFGDTDVSGRGRFRRSGPQGPSKDLWTACFIDRMRHEHNPNTK